MNNNQQQFQFTSNQVPSQYRGKQRTFQPTGMVQSMYGQNQSFKNQYPQQTIQSFHTANYKGQQPNHDQTFRSDSQTPTQSQYRMQNQPQFQIPNQLNTNRSFSTQQNATQQQSGTRQYGTQQYGIPYSSELAQNFQPIKTNSSFSQQQTQFQPSQSSFNPSYTSGKFV